MKSRRIAIIGASADRRKWGNKAVRAYLKKGYDVVPINPKEKKIEGLKCYPQIEDVPGMIDEAAFYVPSAIGEQIAKGIIKKKIPLVHLNPGTESDALIETLKKSQHRSQGFVQHPQDWRRPRNLLAHHFEVSKRFKITCES